MKLKRCFKQMLLNLGGIGILTSSIISCQSNTQAKHSNQKIQYLNHYFKNKREALDWVSKNAKKFKIDPKDYSKNFIWKLQNGDSKVFDNGYDVRKFFNKQVSKIQINTSLDLQKIKEQLFGNQKSGVNKYDNWRDSEGSINQKTLIQLLNDQKTKNNKVTIYCGFNNSLWLTKEQAKNSYLQIHNLYAFNNHSFRTKNELLQYLLINHNKNEVRDELDNSVEKWKIKAPNGIASDYFNWDEGNELSSESKTMIRKFIKNNLETYLAYKTGLKENGEDNYEHILLEDLVKGAKMGDIITGLKLSDINAFKINSTKGERTWLIDSDKDDEANFYGKYFYKSVSASIKKIKDVREWKKNSDYLDPSRLKTYKEASFIVSFFSTLAQMTGGEESGELFDTDDYNYKNLEDKMPYYILESLKNVSTTMKKGKRYNPIYEIPILYRLGISRLIKANAKNDVLKAFKDYFIYATNKLQNKIDAIIPFGFRPRKKLIDLFHIESFGFDINVSPESFLAELVEDTNFMIAIKTFMLANANATVNAGILPIEAYKEKIGIGKNESIDEKLKLMWKLHSSISPKLSKKKLLDWNRLQKKDNVNASNGFDIIGGVIAKKAAAIKKISDSYAESVAKYQSKKNEYSTLTIESKKSYKFKQNEEYERVIKRTNLEKGKKLGPKELRESVSYKKTVEINVATKMKIKVTKKTNSKTLRSKISKKVKRISQAANQISAIVNIVQVFNSKNLYETFSNLSSLSSTLAGITAEMPLVGLVFEGAAVALDLVAQIIGKTSVQNYAYLTADGKKEAYYWDGGKTTTRFWGLWTHEDRGIKDMKLIEPLKILEGFSEDFTYYNGKRFQTQSAVIRQAIIDYVNGDANAFKNPNKNFRKSYSFGKDGKEMYYGKIKDEFNENGTSVKEGVVTKIMNRILISLNNSQEKSNYFGGKQVILTDGTISFNDSDTLYAQLKKIVDNIKPKLVVQVPVLQKGIFNKKEFYPADQVNSKNNNAILPYVPPGNLWTTDNKNYNNKNQYTYLEIDLNTSKGFKEDPEKSKSNSNKKKSLKYFNTEKDAKNILTQKFYSLFNVKSITTTRTSVAMNNNFSSLKPIQNVFLFKIKSLLGRSKYFFTFEEAYKWLTSKHGYNLEIQGIKPLVDKYIFNHKVFKNKTELMIQTSKELDLIMKGVK